MHFFCVITVPLSDVEKGLHECLYSAPLLSLCLVSGRVLMNFLILRHYYHCLVSGVGFRVSDFKFWFSGYGFRVSNFGIRDRGDYYHSV